MIPAGLSAIRLLAAGRQTDAAGKPVALSRADLLEIALAYDADHDPAPIVVGIPKVDDPAQGWVERLDVDGDHLVAITRDIAPDFAGAVKAGRYGRVFAKFYAPDSPYSPSPGNWYLQHIGFRDAAQARTNEAGTIAFSETASHRFHSFSLAMPEATRSETISPTLRAIRLMQANPDMPRDLALDRAHKADALEKLLHATTDPVARNRVARAIRAFAIQHDNGGSFGAAMRQAGDEDVAWQIDGNRTIAPPVRAWRFVHADPRLHYNAALRRAHDENALGRLMDAAPDPATRDGVARVARAFAIQREHAVSFGEAMREARAEAALDARHDRIRSS